MLFMTLKCHTIENLGMHQMRHPRFFWTRLQRASWVSRQARGSIHIRILRPKVGADFEAEPTQNILRHVRQGGHKMSTQQNKSIRIRRISVT